MALSSYRTISKLVSTHLRFRRMWRGSLSWPLSLSYWPVAVLLEHVSVLDQFLLHVVIICFSQSFVCLWYQSAREFKAQNSQRLANSFEQNLKICGTQPRSMWGIYSVKKRGFSGASCECGPVLLQSVLYEKFVQIFCLLQIACLYIFCPV
jgi:hypothetical protein